MRRQTLAPCLSLLGAFLLFELVFSAPASASVVGKVVGKVVGGLVGETVAEGAVGAFKGILKFLFGGLAAKLTVNLLDVLVHVSLYTGGAIGSLYNLTSGIAIAALGGIMTLSVFRYWVSGLTGGDDTFSAFKGVTRSIGTVCFILLWPWIFLQIQGIVNHVDTAILTSPTVEGNIATLLRVTGAANPLALASPAGMIINIIIAILYAILMLGLFTLKIVLTYSSAVIYVAMPLGVILWPIEEFSWIPKMLMRILGLSLLIPLVWTLVFATWSAVGDNAINFRGSIAQALLQPLVTIAMLWMAIFLPHSLLRMARHGMGGLGGGGGGRGQVASMTASRMISRQAEGFVAAQGILPYGVGGRITEQRAAALRQTERGRNREENRQAKLYEHPWKANSGDSRAGGNGHSGGVSKKDMAKKAVTVTAAATTGGASEGVEAAGKLAAAGKAAGATGKAAEAQVPGTKNANGSTASNTKDARVTLANQRAARSERPRDREQTTMSAAETSQKMTPEQAALIDRAGSEMYQRARDNPSSSKDVAAAMERLKPETQHQIAQTCTENPDGLRNSIAHTMYSPDCGDAERQALSTIGSARMQQADEGIGVAMSRLDSPRREEPNTQPPIAPGHAPTPTPPSDAPNPAPAHPPTGDYAQTTHADRSHPRTIRPPFITQPPSK